MDNDFLLEKAAEVRGFAIQDLPLFYVVVAEDKGEPWYLWNGIMILFYQNSLRGIVCIGNYTHFEKILTIDIFQIPSTIKTHKRQQRKPKKTWLLNFFLDSWFFGILEFSVFGLI